MGDKSYEEIVEIAEEQVEAGTTAYFKWTCPQCGVRNTFQEPNSIYRNGECCVCKEITKNISGYGLLIAFTLGKEFKGPDPKIKNPKPPKKTKKGGKKK